MTSQMISRILNQSLFPKFHPSFLVSSDGPGVPSFQTTTPRRMTLTSHTLSFHRLFHHRFSHSFGPFLFAKWLPLGCKPLCSVTPEQTLWATRNRPGVLRETHQQVGHVRQSQTPAERCSMPGSGCSAWSVLSCQRHARFSQIRSSNAPSPWRGVAEGVTYFATKSLKLCIWSIFKEKHPWCATQTVALYLTKCVGNGHKTTRQ